MYLVPICSVQGRQAERLLRQKHRVVIFAGQFCRQFPWCTPLTIELHEKIVHISDQTGLSRLRITRGCVHPFSKSFFVWKVSSYAKTTWIDIFRKVFWFLKFSENFGKKYRKFRLFRSISWHNERRLVNQIFSELTHRIGPENVNPLGFLTEGVTVGHTIITLLNRYYVLEYIFFWCHLCSCL